MAETNWSHRTPQATYQNQYDQGHAPAYRPEPPVVDPRHTMAASRHVHPAHGGPAPHPQQHPSHHHPHLSAVPYGHDAPMADLTEDPTQTDPGAMGGPAAPGGLGTVFNYAGAALSLALIVGLGVWGYKLAVRDVTGIPVVRALEGPMRVQPDNPGGLSAAHQGLAVNSVQSEGQASAPADRLVLAPAPDELADEDIATQVSARSDTSPSELLPLQEASAVIPAPEPLPVDPVAAALAIAERVAASAEPLSSDAVVAAVAAAPETAPAAEAADGPKIIPASVPGVRQSPRPEGRPMDLDTRVAAAPAAGAANGVAAVTDVAPDQIAAGTRLVQLGAFDSADVARAEWDKLAVRFEDYLDGKSRVIQQAQSGGKTFYRLRAMGFEDLADARRFCSVLMASKAACIPVVNR